MRNVPNGAKHITLDNFASRRFLTDAGWVDAPDAELEWDDIDDIMSWLGRRCQGKAWDQLRNGLINSSQIPGSALTQRVQYDPRYGWEFVAGQSYPDELRELRKDIKRAG